MMENDKYIVFKREDWEALSLALPESERMQHQLQDAIVIRRQDIFAGPGLFAYANAIQTAIDLLQTEADGNVNLLFHPRDHERLEELRDFFWEQAMMASHAERKKIPD